MPEVSLKEVQDANTDTPVASGVLTSMSVKDTDKLGPTSDFQYAPKPEPSLAERVGEDLGKPFVQAYHSAGSGLLWMGDYLKDETPFGGLGDRTTRMGIVMRERADKVMKDNFSNYTPNMLDDLVGMVPSVAGYLGVAALSPELAAITMIGGAGAALTAEEFAKFKDKGRSTPAASALALAVGVPTTGVMALGWGAVSKLTEPWLTDVIGNTIGKLASQVAGGSAMFGGQAFTEGSLELATGAEP